MRLTRRELLAGGTAAAALGAVGVYELVDQLTAAPTRHFGEGRAPEQHLLDGLRIADDNGVEIVVPTLHHEMVTATVSSRPGLQEQAALERVLRHLEDKHPGTPDGLAVTAAWGLPYFRQHVGGAAERHLPVDRRASASGRARGALLDSIRFPSDPDDVVLEENDVAFLLRSDNLDHIQEGATEIFDGMDGVLEMTSIRKGFAGGGFDGGPGLPKQLATAAGVPGADLIPDGSELFLGFTSTQRHALGPPRIVNFETLGLVDLSASEYFRGGTNMHLSHLFEDLEAWYLDFDYRGRVDTTFRPGFEAREGAQTLSQAPEDAASEADLKGDFSRTGAIGHSGSIQPTSRLQMDIKGADGETYAKGSAIPLRADFNTLDNPFFWTSDPERDRHSEQPDAGLHFITFNPSSDDFRRNRLAMDGVLPDGTELPLEARSRAQGLNSVLRTTHRQNYLVPPRSHRSFPLVELLG